MVLNNRCIVCGSSTELNTVINISIEGKKYDVAICDKHAEDTTAKKAKDLVQKKLNELDELLKKMKDFGIQIPEDQLQSHQILVAEKTPTPTMKKESSTGEVIDVEPTLAEGEVGGNDEKKAIVLRKASLQKMQVQKKIQYQKPPEPSDKNAKQIIKSAVGHVQSVAGVAQDERNRVSGVTLDKRSSHDVASVITEGIGKLKERGYIRKDQDVVVPVPIQIDHQMVPGRKGIPMKIPKIVRDSNGGVTTIAVVDTGGDKTIQDRFKQLADESRRTEGNTAYSFGEKGYDVMNCSLCEGTGKTRATGGTCPKCKGAGILNRGR